MARNVLTMRDLEEIIDSWSDEEDTIESVTVLPPDGTNDATDEEQIDDDFIPLNDCGNASAEIAGSVEIRTRRDNYECAVHTDIEEAVEVATTVSNMNTSDAVGDLPIDEPSTSSGHTKRTCRAHRGQPKVVKKAKVIYKPVSAYETPKWSGRRRNKFNFNISPVHEPLGEVQFKIMDALDELSPIQLFLKFFDSEVMKFIVDQTLKYAQQQNNFHFVFDEVLLRRFLGVLLISGYHTLPHISDYWSQNPTLGIAIVKQAMSRTRFIEIKRYLHFCDNNRLNPANRMAKVSS